MDHGIGLVVPATSSPSPLIMSAQIQCLLLAFTKGWIEYTWPPPTQKIWCSKAMTTCFVKALTGYKNEDNIMKFKNFCEHDLYCKPCFIKLAPKLLPIRAFYRRS